MMKCSKRIMAYRIIEVVFVVLIILGLRMIYLQKVNGAEAIEDMPYAVLEVTGGSMEPVLSQGDGIFVYEVPFEQLEKDDVIVFWQDGELVTHQIIEVGEGEVTTQGTANSQPDSPVTEADYRAKVIGTIPLFGIISVFFQEPIYMVCFIILLFLIVFGYDIMSAIYDYVAGRKQKKGEI